MSGNVGMEALIPIVNKVQDAFTQVGMNSVIDLPQIAVVGGQSAGKSSVLENCVGKDFLPRGTGICTRRPLILQLNFVEKGEWGEFLHAKGKKFTDFDEIRKEIEAETDRMTGSNKGISDIPINLRIFSPHVLNLTLIDLPGITKVPIGDQPPDIEHQIRGMIMQFISKPSCLILAVTPANSDLANSDALKLAKEVDPEGIRTIGVLTKLDLMDDGTDSRDILDNKVLPLRRGYIGVVNRSQRDIEGKKDIKAAQAAERKYFLTHPSYRHLAERAGTAFLQKTLNQQLTNHIREVLPSLRSKLEQQMTSMESEVKEFKNLGMTGGREDKSARPRMMMQMVNRVTHDFEQMIEGGGNAVDTKTLSGGAKINTIFHFRFPGYLNEGRLDEKELRKEIGFAIRNIHGVRSGLFTPDAAFEMTVKRQIDTLCPPSMKCIQQVSTELHEVIMKCIDKIKNYPRLQAEIDNLVSGYLRECETFCREQIQQLVEVELSYINTNHDDFIGFNSTAKDESVKDVAAGGGGESQSGKASKAQQAPGRESKSKLIKKGWLSTSNVGLTKGLSREYWFVLYTDALAWFKDESERDQKYYLTIDGVKMKEEEEEEGGGIFGHRKFKIQLFHPNARYLFREYRELSLFAKDEDDMEDWRASFLRAGIYTHRSQIDLEDLEDDDRKPKFERLFEDPQLERQVEVIRTYVNSYMAIVRKTFKDVVPKHIMCLMVNKMKVYIETELMPCLYGAGNPAEMMEESEDEIRRRQELLGMYDACKDALKTISEVTAKTSTAPLPPPVARNNHSHPNLTHPTITHQKMIAPLLENIAKHAARGSPSPNMNASRMPKSDSAQSLSQNQQRSGARPPPNLPNRPTPNTGGATGRSNPPILPTKPQTSLGSDWSKPSVNVKPVSGVNFGVNVAPKFGFADGKPNVGFDVRPAPAPPGGSRRPPPPSRPARPN
ncbi:dynamin-1-like isoform X5 [Bolinopsis microptera]|uniref:dynamin-1-like isoform X5 n=1 Tax=Bolinopsis microptera TaxID=2820187 RepID=UPI0030790ACF